MESPETPGVGGGGGENEKEKDPLLPRHDISRIIILPSLFYFWRLLFLSLSLKIERRDGEKEEESFSWGYLIFFFTPPPPLLFVNPSHDPHPPPCPALVTDVGSPFRRRGRRDTRRNDISICENASNVCRVCRFATTGVRGGGRRFPSRILKQLKAEINASIGIIICKDFLMTFGWPPQLFIRGNRFLITPLPPSSLRMATHPPRRPEEIAFSFCLMIRRIFCSQDWRFLLMLPQRYIDSMSDMYGDAITIDPSNVPNCVSKGKSEHYDCRNHIRVIQPIGDGNRLYICGTNAHNPMDYVIH
ncbi:semaphorin-2A, partial [Caerostris darwini]